MAKLGTQRYNSIGTGSSMRAWGEGTIQKVGQKKFRGAVRINGQRIYGPRVERRAEALPMLWKHIQEMEAQEEAKSAPEPQASLSTYVLRRIVEMRFRSYSPTTVDLWTYTHKRLENDPLGAAPPSSITAEDLQGWVDRQTGAARTVRNYLDNIRAILKAEGNPIPISCKIKHGHVFVPAKKASRIEVPTPAEEAALLALPMTFNVRVMVNLARMGLRLSEIAGLMHEDRDGEGIYIRQAVIRATGIVAIKDTKNDNSESWVPLMPELLDVVGSGTGFVLGKEFHPISPSTLSDRWTTLVRGTVMERFGMHDLRAMHAMRLLEGGVDLRTAAEMTRHDPTVLSKIYARSRRDLKQRASDIVFKPKPKRESA